MAGLEALDLELDWAGAGQGPLRDLGWTRVPLLAPSLRLPAAPPSGEDLVAVARGPLPAGRYDRVFVAAPAVTGWRADGTPEAITSHIEPIARGFDLAPGSDLVVDIELIVLERAAASGGGRQIFVKDARIVEPAPR